MAGQQFLDPIRPIRWQSCEYIFQIGIWAVSVYAIGLDQAYHNRRTLHGAQIPVKSHLEEISTAPDNLINRDFQVATDNGICIAPQALPILFYMFFLSYPPAQPDRRAGQASACRWSQLLSLGKFQAEVL